MRNITIVGPRSVGKTTLCKSLSKKLHLKHIEMDKVVNKKLKKYGGLNTAIKSGAIDNFILNDSVNIIQKVFGKKRIIVDLAGGAISSKRFSESSNRIIKTIKSKSKVIGILPYENNKRSINFLFEREKERVHFKNESKIKLKNKVKEDYLKVKRKLIGIADFIIYTKDRKPGGIVKEILMRVK